MSRKRPNTRAHIREMMAHRSPINRSLMETAEELEDPTTDEEGEIHEQSDQELEVQRDSSLRLDIPKLIKIQGDDESLVANLKNLMQDQEAARKGHNSNLEDSDHESVSDLPQTEKLTNAENNDPAQNIKWWPSLIGQPAKMQPIKGHNSKWPARENSPSNRNKKNKNYWDNDPNSHSETSPDDQQIEGAMKTLIAAFGPNLKISTRSQRAPKNSNQKEKRQRDDCPRNERPDTDTPKMTASRIQRPQTPEPRGYCKYSPTLQTCPRPRDLHPDNSAVKEQSSALRWTHRFESEACMSEGDHYRGAAAPGTFSGDAKAEMSFAHAQYQLGENRDSRMQREPSKLLASIPMPFCEYQDIQHYGQPPAVSNTHNNAGNLPNDFPKLRMDGVNLLEWSQQLQVVFLKENLLFFINNPPKKTMDARNRLFTS